MIVEDFDLKDLLTVPELLGFPVATFIGSPNMKNRLFRSSNFFVLLFKTLLLIMYGICLLIIMSSILDEEVDPSIILKDVVNGDLPVLEGVPNRVVLIGILIGRVFGSNKVYVLLPTVIGVPDDEDVVVVAVEVDDEVDVDVVLVVVVAVDVVLVVAVEVVAVVAVDEVDADVIGIPAMADAIA